MLRNAIACRRQLSLAFIDQLGEEHAGRSEVITARLALFFDQGAESVAGGLKFGFTIGQQGFEKLASFGERVAARFALLINNGRNSVANDCKFIGALVEELRDGAVGNAEGIAHALKAFVQNAGDPVLRKGEFGDPVIKQADHVLMRRGDRVFRDRDPAFEIGREPLSRCSERVTALFQKTRDHLLGRLQHVAGPADMRVEEQPSRRSPASVSLSPRSSSMRARVSSEAMSAP